MASRSPSPIKPASPAHAGQAATLRPQIGHFSYPAG
jgi:hypothetical protein